MIAEINNEGWSLYEALNAGDESAVAWPPCGALVAVAPGSNSDNSYSHSLADCQPRSSFEDFLEGWVAVHEAC